MARILVLSPLPPARTGVASYTASVLDLLRGAKTGDRHRLDARWPGPRNLTQVERLLGAADLPVYHVGNNARYHRDIYALAVRRPGLVVLHDLALDDLGRALVATDDPLGLRTRREAEAARRRLERSGMDLDGPLGMPWCAYLVRRARGIVVHAPFGRRYLGAIGCRTPVFVAPHPPIEDPRGIRAGLASRRVARRIPREATLIGVLGDLGAAKQIETVMKAVARLNEGVHLAVVGRRIPGYDVKAAVRTAGLGRRVSLAADVTDAEFGAWLRASDIVVNLRHPHRGEVSGTVVRALQAGIPTVVSGTGTYLDWPEDTVVRIAEGPPSVDEIAAVLDRLVRDPQGRRRLGERAREHMDRLAREGATAAAYDEAVESTLAVLADPSRGALSRWAGALLDVGATPERTAMGFGLRYAEAVREFEEGASSSTSSDSSPAGR